MSVAPSSTKIFGIRLGVDPKIVIGALLVLAALLFWYNSRGDEGTTATPPAATSNAGSEGVGALPAPPPIAARPVRRSRTAANDRGALRLRPVNGSRGDIDPTLRLDLLARLREVGPPVIGRSLFTIGPSPQQAAAASAAMRGPTIPLQPVQPVQPPDAATAPPTSAAVNIPLRFYGFDRPASKGQSARGLFMDNDIVVVAAEGELIKNRYLVVELTPNSAKLEDTQLKQGQTLPVVPEAVSQ
jgi:hypothetical protein